MQWKGLVVLVLVLLTLAGCGGGSLSTKELQTQAGTVQSLAAEGALVADGAQHGRSTDVFVRVHSRYLAEAARKVESTLASATAGGSLEAKRIRTVELASSVSDDLDQLHRAPGDQALAAELKSDLTELASAAEQIAE